MPVNFVTDARPVTPNRIKGAPATNERHPTTPPDMGCSKSVARFQATARAPDRDPVTAISLPEARREGFWRVWFQVALVPRVGTGQQLPYGGGGGQGRSLWGLGRAPAGGLGEGAPSGGLGAGPRRRQADQRQRKGAEIEQRRGIRQPKDPFTDNELDSPETSPHTHGRRVLGEIRVTPMLQRGEPGSSQTDLPYPIDCGGGEREPTGRGC